jgi:hypothetical protein
MQVKFQQWTCNVRFGKYPNGRTAILLTDTETDQPIAKATVNLPDEPMADDEVAIKDFAENGGMYNVLAMAKIISVPLRIVQVGYENAPICQLLVEPHEHS